jgi:hypothetical protein
VTGAFSITITAEGYSDVPGEALDGTMTATGQIDPYTDEPARMTVTLSDLTFSDYDAGESGSISGTIAFDAAYPDTLMVTLFLTDNVTGKSVWLDRVTIVSAEYYDEIEGWNCTVTSLSGRIYVHDFGFVDVTTPVPFRTWEGDGYPYEGKLLVEGKEGRRVYLEVPDPSGYGDYGFGVDADGDGLFEYEDYDYWGVAY